MKLYVGVDVGKEFLDVSIANQHMRIKNEETGYRILEETLNSRGLKPSEVIVLCEASGGYEQGLLSYFRCRSYGTHLAHANKVKAYARSRGHQAKTDKLDSHVIAGYGEVMAVESDEYVLSAEETQIKNLLVRREQLKGYMKQEKTRLSSSRDPQVRDSIEKTLSYFSKEIKEVENQLCQLKGSSSQLESKHALLCSIPSVGELTACYLSAYLPELGHVSSSVLSALVGVAPYNRDSGQHRGKRYIQGGRKKLRNQLYMVCISSIRYNRFLGDFYRRLRSKGKPAKVAIIAMVRKLLGLLNAVIQRGSGWESREMKCNS